MSSGESGYGRLQRLQTLSRGPLPAIRDEDEDEDELRRRDMVGQSRNLEVESSCGKLRCMCLSNSCVLFLPSLAEEDGMG